MKNINEVIQSNLELKNMTQSQLGEKLGLSQRAISKYVTGKSLPPLDTFISICNILDININAIFPFNNAVVPLNTDETRELLLYRNLSQQNKTIIMNLLKALENK